MLCLNMFLELGEQVFPPASKEYLLLPYLSFCLPLPTQDVCWAALLVGYERLTWDN